MPRGRSASPRAPVPDRDRVALGAPGERERPAAWLRHIDDRGPGTAWSHVPLDAAVDHHLGAVQRGGDQQVCGVRGVPGPLEFPQDLVVAIRERWRPERFRPPEGVADDAVPPPDELSLGGGRARQRLTSRRRRLPHRRASPTSHGRRRRAGVPLGLHGVRARGERQHHQQRRDSEPHLGMLLLQGPRIGGRRQSRPQPGRTRTGGSYRKGEAARAPAGLASTAMRPVLPLHKAAGGAQLDVRTDPRPGPAGRAFLRIPEQLSVLVHP